MLTELRITQDELERLDLFYLDHGGVTTTYSADANGDLDADKLADQQEACWKTTITSSEQAKKKDDLNPVGEERQPGY